MLDSFCHIIDVSNGDNDGILLKESTDDMLEFI